MDCLRLCPLSRSLGELAFRCWTRSPCCDFASLAAVSSDRRLQEYDVYLSAQCEPPRTPLHWRPECVVSVA